MGLNLLYEPPLPIMPLPKTLKIKHSPEFLPNPPFPLHQSAKWPSSMSFARAILRQRPRSAPPPRAPQKTGPPSTYLPRLPARHPRSAPTACRPHQTPPPPHISKRPMQHEDLVHPPPQSLPQNGPALPRLPCRRPPLPVPWQPVFRLRPRFPPHHPSPPPSRKQRTSQA